jgi:hypothetical protein
VTDPALYGFSKIDPAARTGAPTPATEDLVGRIRTGVRDVHLLILGASSAALADGWVDRFAGKIAAQFRTHTISYRKWNGVSDVYDAAAVTAGSGPRTIHIWNGSRAGQTWEWYTDVARRQALIVDTTPDLVIVSAGHNENNTLAQAGNMNQLRDKAVVHIETIRGLVPEAVMVLSSQNPLLTYNVASEHRADAYRRIALERGYGFIDALQAFYADGRPFTDLVSVDGIHCTPAGMEVWSAEMARHFPASGSEQPPPQPLPPAFYDMAGRNFAPNPFFSDFAAPPTLPSWTATNTTLAKDTTNFETGSWSLRMTKAAGGAASFIEHGIVNDAWFAGRTVTFAARIRVPAGQASTIGTVNVIGGPIEGSTSWPTVDQWLWRMVTVKIPTSTTNVRLRITLDPTTGAAADMSVDRMVFILGRYPADDLA